MKREHVQEIVGTIVHDLYLLTGSTPSNNCLVWDEKSQTVKAVPEGGVDPDIVLAYDDETASPHTVWVFVSTHFAYCPDCGGYTFQNVHCYECRNPTHTGEEITTTTLMARPMQE